MFNRPDWSMRTWSGLILAAGISVRLIWLLHAGFHGEPLYEAGNVAMAFARTGTLADAYRAGSGPTAHLLPVNILIAGYVYRLLGIGSPAANIVLSLWSIALVMASFALLSFAFGKAGMRPRVRLAALLFLCILPFNHFYEVIWFRVWEGAFATALGALFLALLVSIDGARDWGLRALIGLTLLAAITFFVSPQIGLGAVVAFAMFAIHRLPARRWAGAFAVCAAAFALVLAPWALRNQRTMGSLIVLRSNLGLEMAIAFHPTLPIADPAAQFRARMAEVHPSSSEAAYRRMQQAGGEVAYFKELQRETTRWMLSNPRQTISLALSHLVQFVFPPLWLYQPFAPSAYPFVLARMSINWAIFGLGIIGAGWALVRATIRYRYAAAMTLVPIVPYLLVQPVLRYRYVVFAIMVFFAFDLIDKVYGEIRARIGKQSVLER